ncbi:Flp pilus assembly complex ATPase component TadA [Burkholderia gladioli]|uniref:ATPase, T2SS/T4P/T4SS family n=1 Tax=Burkholderia gladioli TaxID=28095 RepID=UPI0028566AC8|nr:ATPase, T2SS/T4P/T4SS family [Burkholderia gladioli]MDR8092969.1 Flp pilus assembly complex ATPase component TadA [Burkholderia gladioli]
MRPTLAEAKAAFKRLFPLRQANAADKDSDPVIAALEERKFGRVVTKARDVEVKEIANGALVAESEVIAIDDLPRFTRTLQAGVVQKEFHRSICPIQVVQEGSSSKRLFAVVLLREMLQADVTEEAIAALSKEYELATPAVYIATQNVLSELIATADGQQGAQRLNSEADGKLWRGFVEMVEFGLDFGVSDFHIRVREGEEYSQVSFRMDGSSVRPRRFRIATSLLIRIMSYLYSFHGNSNSTNAFSIKKPLECNLTETINGRNLAFRWGQLPVHGGAKITLRMIHLDASETFTSLGRVENGAGFTDHQVKIWERNIYSAGGLTIIGGVVNSGKSKTTQTVLSLLPSDLEINTAEDPIENPLKHEGANQYSTSRSMGSDDSDPFDHFNLMNKRTDPDVTFIGEVRDIKTAGATRDATLSGQRVFTTLHVNDALVIPERLASPEFGLTREVLSLPSFLKLLVYQALVPKNCPHCALELSDPHTVATLKQIAEDAQVAPAIARAAALGLRTASVHAMNRIERLFQFDPKRMRVRNPLGCPHCLRENVPELNGLRGRALVAQMIEPDFLMLEMIRDAKNIDLFRYYRSLRTTGFDDSNTDGKSPMQIAMFNVSLGELCMSQVERRFQSLDAYEYQVKQFERQGKSATVSLLPSRGASRKRVVRSATRRVVRIPRAAKGAVAVA